MKGPTVEDPREAAAGTVEGQHEMQPDEKLKTLNRKQRRKTIKRDGIGGAAAGRFHSSARTGSTPHFSRWQTEAGIKSALQRLSIAKLERSASVAGNRATVTAFNLLRGTNCRNAWDISIADKRDLLAAPGMGPARLKLIAEHLTSRGVRIAWEV